MNLPEKIRKVIIILLSIAMFVVATWWNLTQRGGTQ